jgi:Zn-dependent protease
MFLFCAISSVNTTNMGIAYIAFFFYYAAQVNVSLGVFNLLPIPPLDGSRLATALLPSHIYYKIMQYERYIYYGLMLLIFTNVLDAPIYLATNSILNGFCNILNLSPFLLYLV